MSKYLKIFGVLAVLAISGIAAAQSYSQLPNDQKWIKHLYTTLKALSAAELGVLESAPSVLSCSQSSEFGSVITATMTLQTADAVAVAQGGWFDIAFSTDSAGLTLVSSSNDPSVVTDGTGSIVEAGVASTQDRFRARTSAAGVVTMAVVLAGNSTVYLTADMPDGTTSACLTLDFD